MFMGYYHGAQEGFSKNGRKRPKDCKVSGWMNMTSCSASCGGGVVRQAREVLSESSRGILALQPFAVEGKINKDSHGGFTCIYILYI